MSRRVRQLRQLLAAIEPADLRAVGQRRRMQRLLALGEPALDRHTLSPGHFTASALVLDPGATRLLLVYHQWLRRWLQPGGHLEPVDSDIATAAPHASSAKRWASAR